MGIVQPQSTFPAFSKAENMERPSITMPFPPSPQNPTLSALKARKALQLQADQDLENVGRPGCQGRQLLDIRAVIDAMRMRERGIPSRDIESRMGLEPGVMDRLGRTGLLSHVSTGG